MRPIFLSLSLCLFATALEAGPDRFSILLGSKHIGGTGFNEVNPGFFVTWERERSSLSVGAFMNSYELCFNCCDKLPSSEALERR